MSPRAQLLAGATVFLAGAVGVAAGYRPVSAFSYPILWWGLLPALDAIHYLRWHTSPMRRDWRHFAGITVPASVLFWLTYEYLNLAFPQWAYSGYFEGRFVESAIGVLSFATVIPIMVELHWFFAGPEPRLRPVTRLGSSIFVAAGALALALPLLTDWFWMNQAAWAGPALLLLPFVGVAGFAAVPTGLAAGFLWELLNYWSLTKWRYTIHPEWPKLFEMPLLGYLGFIPFAFSTLALYAVLRRVRPRAPTIAALWVAAAAAMLAITVVWAVRGFYTPLR